MSNTVLLDVLLNNNEITDDQHREITSLQRKSRKLAGMLLLEKGYVTEDTLTRYLSMEYDEMVLSGTATR